MPRQATDLPGLEVNAAIHRPSTANADALLKLLGVGTDLAQNIAGDIQQNQDNKDSAQAELDFAQGNEDPNRFSKSRAYREAWQLQGAKSLAIKVSDEVTQQANALLNDPDHPATLQDLDALFEKTVSSHLQDAHIIGPDGKPTGAVTPKAQLILGNALAKLKADLVPQFAKGIRDQKNEKLYGTTFSNMLFERDAGQPIGTPPGATIKAPDPLAPLPEGAPKARTVTFGKPTGKLPIQGKITSTFAQHIARGSHGVDIDGVMGQPITAPAGGTVTVGQDKKSGLFVRIDHGDGVVSSYAHLSGTSLKSGDVIQAGETLGKVGNSGHTVGEGGGDGSHLHYRVKVNGVDVNPLTFAFKGGGAGVVVEDGSEPQLQSAQVQATQLRPGFNVEQFMASLPPSVDKGEAKQWLIENLIAQAASTKDTSLLNGLEDSKRKDGFPSFTAAERLKITETRERLEDQNRIEADRAEAKLQTDNYKTVLQAFAEGHPPSTSWLTEQSRKGLLNPEHVYSLVEHIEAEQKADAREARMEAKQAQAEEDSDLDAFTYGEEAKLRGGDLSGKGWQELFESGALGSGKKAAARALRLQAATTAGQKMAEQDPQFAYFSGMLKQNFKPRKMGDGPLMLLKPQSAIDDATYAAMMSSYRQKVEKGGKSPDEAYTEVVKQYAPNGGKKDVNAQLSSIAQQIAELKAKKRAAGR
jgi:murein DD-endopeptidase MepM/ murein hydrolase activator NlpD